MRRTSKEGRFAERVVSGVDDLGVEERIVIWIERKPGGLWAVGRAVAAWAAEGRRLTPAAVRRFYREAWGRGKTVAKAMAAQAKRARPKRSWFRRKTKPAE